MSFTQAFAVKAFVNRCLLLKRLFAFRLSCQRNGVPKNASDAIKSTMLNLGLLIEIAISRVKGCKHDSNERSTGQQQR